MTRNELENLIAQNQTEKTFDVLLEMLKGTDRPELLRTVIIQNARFIEHRNLHINKMLSQDEFWQVRSEIHYALLTVIAQLGEASARPNHSPEAAPGTIHISGSEQVMVNSGNISTGGDFIIGSKTTHQKD